MREQPEELSINLNWNRTTPDFKYDTFDRTHTIKYMGGAESKMTSSPKFKGDPSLPTPEEALAGAVAGCHFLTFMAIASKSGYTVDRYEDEVKSLMLKDEEGISYVARISLNPKVTFSGDKIPDREKLERLHDKAHKYCFIARSVKSEVVIHF